MKPPIGFSMAEYIAKKKAGRQSLNKRIKSRGAGRGDGGVRAHPRGGGGGGGGAGPRGGADDFVDLSGI